MNGSSFKDIEKLEADLWSAEDNLRANSKLTSGRYFMPVLGIIFLRRAANRFDIATQQIEANKASGKMPKRSVIDYNYIKRRDLPLPEKARYDWFCTPSYRHHVVRAATGTSVKHTSPNRILTYTVLIPISDRLVANFERAVEPLFHQVLCLGEANQTLRAARDLLLPQLMSGKVAI